jgi:hypothetical protein
MAARPHHASWFAWLALLAGLTIPIASAAAQTTKPDQPIANGPGQNGAVTEEGKSGAPLSEQLAKSDGVLHPAQPSVDQEMAQQPPSTGPNSTPVITPNESPAPDTKVAPK